MAKCKKKKFRDELAVKMALARIKNKGGREVAKNECRGYRCPDCKTWHLTSRK